MRSRRLRYRSPRRAGAYPPAANGLAGSGLAALARGQEVLRRIQLLCVNDRVLNEAGRLEPADVRSLDAIHLASARQLGSAVKQFVTYDERMASAATAAGWTVASPR